MGRSHCRTGQPRSGSRPEGGIRRGLQGNPRTVGAAPDIGADEYAPPKEAPAAPQP